MNEEVFNTAGFLQYVEDKPDLSELIDKLRKLSMIFSAETARGNAPAQGEYVVEEMTELCQACLDWIKLYKKNGRHRASMDDVFEELVDVFVTLMVFCFREGLMVNQIKAKMLYKIDRAIARYDDNGAV